MLVNSGNETLFLIFIHCVLFTQRPPPFDVISLCQNRFWTSCVDLAIWIKFGIGYDLRRIIWVVISSKIASPKCALMYLKATLPKAWQWRNAIQKLQTKDFCLISKLWKHNKNSSPWVSLLSKWKLLSFAAKAAEISVSHRIFPFPFRFSYISKIKRILWKIWFKEIQIM